MGFLTSIPARVCSLISVFLSVTIIEMVNGDPHEKANSAGEEQILSTQKDGRDNDDENN